MTTLPSPASRSLKSLSPSSYQVIAACPLRFAFGQGGGHGSWIGTPATHIGDLCHSVLQAMVEERGLWGTSWPDDLARCWATELEKLVGRLGGAAADWGRPETWPDYQLKKARLKRVAACLRELVIGEPPETVFAVEAELRGASGRLQGRADLILRRPGAHRIIDFKTGRAVDRLTGAVHQGYEHQLQLYAFMEHQTTGEWPTEAYLLPLEGEPVAVNIDPAISEAVASKALSLLDDYNSRVPGEQPAHAMPQNCRYCPYSGICPAFWDAYDDSWEDEILAVVGTVVHIFHTTVAGTNLELVRLAGLTTDRVLIRNVDPALHPIINQVVQGDVVAAVGFRPDFEHESYHLTPTAVLASR